MNTGLPLRNRRAVVTGGSRGIGADIVRALHAAGAQVVVNYRSNRVGAERVVGELNRRRKDSARAVGVDVANRDEVAQLFATADEWLGGVDILINNAGFEECHHLLDVSLESWNRVVATNLTGPFLCTQEAGRRMETQFSGDPTQDAVIINVSSIHGTVPRKGFASYCAAKAGLNMLTKATALELAEYNVRAITVSPGAIETDMNREEIASIGADRFGEWIPLGRVGNAGDVSGLVAFLCGPQGTYITGTNIYADGGYMQSLIQYDPRPPRAASYD